MLFSKLRAKSDEELLPPPPPFPSMEIEEEASEKATKLERVDREYAGLLEDVKGLGEKKAKKTELKKKVSKPKAVLAKKLPIEKIKPKKSLIKAKEAPKKIVKKAKLRLAKKPLPAKTKLLKKERLPKAVLPKIKESFGIGRHELEKELELPAESAEPEAAEDYGINETEKYAEDAKPKEILEAEEEITSAIGKIRKLDVEGLSSQPAEKHSLFGRFFSRKAEPKESLPAAAEEDGIQAIKSRISKAREELMKFDLEAARKGYIEIMKVYNRISPEEQAKVYQEIRDLYYERKSAEELKV